MKKKIITKKRVMIGIITVILVTAAIIVSLLIYAQKQMEKIPSMSAMECLEYTLRDNTEAVISVGMIQKDGQMLWTVYGNNCDRLPTELHRYEIGSLTKTITAAMIAPSHASREM